MNAAVVSEVPNWLPPEFSVSTAKAAGGMIVSVEGELDRATVEAVRREVTKRRKRPGDSLVLDLSRTTFMDTSGLHLIRELDISAVVVATRRVRRVLELASPPGRVRVVSTLGEARLPAGTNASERSAPCRASLAGE